jgi:dolichol kinase
MDFEAMKNRSQNISTGWFYIILGVSVAYNFQTENKQNQTAYGI